MRTCVLLSFLICAAALAQSDDPFDHRFSVSAGGYWPDIDTTIRADGNGGRVGTSLDLESELGLTDRDTLLAGGMTWNITRRHSLDLLYFELGRRGTRNISRDINFRDQTYPFQSTINSLFETNVLRLSYGYAFIADDRQRLMGQFGVHYTQVKAGLDTATGSIRAEADTDVPLPVIGIAYQRRLGEHFAFDVTAQIFRLTFDDYDGSLNNAVANFYWGPARHFTMFVGYNYYSINLDANKDHWNGSFDFGYHGPWAGVLVGFGATK
ncbi:hypothetical protein [Peristeroidobacter soli]|jgi:hypothetical protein|uniref:hypothetical protein n=1 Tax=Peristeroidobacter soli TaxID=2497877 RepID=UPI00101E0667|nr:hypothetical protein [Peristeroidobacter soli]